MALIASGSCLSSCMVAGTEQDNSVPSVTLKEVSSSSNAGSTFVRVVAHGDWKLSLEGADGWAGLSHESGTGNKADILLSWIFNSEESSRACTVLLECAGTVARAEFTQAGRPAQGQPSFPEVHGIPGWMEMPVVKEGSNLRFVTHDMQLGSSRVRNYSFLLDTDAYIALWVAYPLNKALIGSGSRSDTWGLDPKVPRDCQSVIFTAYKGGFQRGHQLPSADRYTDNASTFYGTNMTPQRGVLNENAWASLEGMVRNWSYQFDTLYVVTGADINGSRETALDNDGKSVTVPVGYFKALLGYRKSATIGITGTTGGYTGIAFYFEHRYYEDSQIMKNAMTIDELEARLGYDFFPNLAGQIGAERAEKVESTRDSWWK